MSVVLIRDFKKKLMILLKLLYGHSTFGNTTFTLIPVSVFISSFSWVFLGNKTAPHGQGVAAFYGLKMGGPYSGACTLLVGAVL